MTKRNTVPWICRKTVDSDKRDAYFFLCLFLHVFQMKKYLGMSRNNQWISSQNVLYTECFHPEKFVKKPKGGNIKKACFSSWISYMCHVVVIYL